MTKSSVLSGVVCALVLALFGGSAHAGKCEASKTKCASKKAAGLLKCHAKAEKSGTVVDPACTSKVMDKFDDPTTGCIAKVEAKGGCVVTGATATLEATIDTFVVTDIVPALDPFFPGPIPGGNLCSSKKKGCVAKKVKGLLKCYAKAEKKSLAIDPACLQKAMDKFDGGSTPAKGCFAKREAIGSCLTVGDTAAIEAVVDVFVEDAVCQIDPASCPTTTSTTTTSTTSTTVGSVCGNLIVEPGEDCETDPDCAVGEICTAACDCVPNNCPDVIELTMHAGTGVLSTATELDLGYAGNTHGLDLADQARLALAISGVSGTGPASCGEATIAGIDPSLGNCRCDTDNSASCQSPFALDAASCSVGVSCSTSADCKVCSGDISIACLNNDGCNECSVTGGPCVSNGDCPSGETCVDQVNGVCLTGAQLPTCSGGQCVGSCECFLAPPEPVSGGNVPACFVRKLGADVTGTWNLDTGASALDIALLRRIYLGELTTVPCPTCVGDVTANDGVRDGTCSKGRNDGESCDANSSDATFPAPSGGDYSYDCFPDDGKNLTGTGLASMFTLTTGSSSLSANVACGWPVIAPEICPCGVCSGDSSIACSSNSDCGGAGTCGGAAVLVPRANECTGSSCTDLGGGEGECTTGPDQTFCNGVLRADGTPFVTCISNVDCDNADCGSGAGAGLCGTCSLTKRRECFLDPIVATGTASTTDPVAIATYCMSQTASPGANAVIGLPGPARVKIDSSSVSRCPGGVAYPPCP